MRASPFDNIRRLIAVSWYIVQREHPHISHLTSSVGVCVCLFSQ